MDPRIRIHTKMSWIRNTGQQQPNSISTKYEKLPCLQNFSLIAGVVDIVDYPLLSKKSANLRKKFELTPMVYSGVV